jgi:ArsR family transcriptional regulator, arsenate/arsenite/antimonite-responsive transcriptional repressor
MVVNGYDDRMSPVATREAVALQPVALRVKGCCNPVAPPLADSVAEQLADLHRAIGDPTRVQILHILKAAKDPVCVCDFTASFELGQPTISHHLAKLREAGLIVSQKRGIWAFYALAPNPTPAARAALDAIP